MTTRKEFDRGYLESLGFTKLKSVAKAVAKERGIEGIMKGGKGAVVDRLVAMGEEETAAASDHYIGQDGRVEVEYLRRLLTPRRRGEAEDRVPVRGAGKRQVCEREDVCGARAPGVSIFFPVFI